MDTSKVKPCAGTNNLEKGYPKRRAQPESPHDEDPPFIVRHPHLGPLCWVILAWFVLVLGRHVFLKLQNAWQWWDGHEVEHPPHPQAPSFPIDGDINQCVEDANWTYFEQPPWASDYPYGAEAAFSLPIDADALALISKGGFQQGSVNIEQSTEIADTVNVNVRAAYRIEEVFERATVCQLEKADNEYGVGIFTPNLPLSPRHGRNNQVNFALTFILPAGPGGSLSLKKLETSLPNYSQNIADLQKSVFFDAISLWSANGKLSVQSVTSEVGQFTTLNGEIEGQFHALSSLDLHTLNGRIAPKVNVLHRKGEEPSHLSIRTMNGQIDAEVTLTSETLTGGEFNVEAESKHGQVGLKFGETPVDSVLHCRAETTVGGVQVELDSAFEGSYSLQTMLGGKDILERDVEDPAGKGRERIVSQNKGVRHVEGEVKWVEKDGSSAENEGHVLLKALVSSVKLIL